MAKRVRLVQHDEPVLLPGKDDEWGIPVDVLTYDDGPSVLPVDSSRAVLTVDDAYTLIRHLLNAVQGFDVAVAHERRRAVDAEYAAQFESTWGQGGKSDG